MGRSLLFHGAGTPMELVRFSEPSPRGAELLVRVTCCTLCRSDLHTHAGLRNQPNPTILGHEIVGRIEAFGPEASRSDARGLPVSVGSRVSWAVAVGCGRCFFCTEDLPQKVRAPLQVWSRAGDTGTALGRRTRRHGDTDAGDRLVRRARRRLRPSGRARELRHGDYRSHAKARGLGCRASRPGVRGRHAGGDGVRFMAQAAGASTVLASDPDPSCLERAAAFGATHTFSSRPDEQSARVGEATQGRGADVVLELAGVPASVTASLSLVRTGGILILAGTVSPVGDVGFDPESVVRRMLTIRGVHNYSPRDLESALTFLAGPGRGFPFESLVAAEYPLDQAEQAFAKARAHPGVRIAVVS